MAEFVAPISHLRVLSISTLDHQCNIVIRDGNTTTSDPVAKWAVLLMHTSALNMTTLVSCALSIPVTNKVVVKGNFVDDSCPARPKESSHVDVIKREPLVKVNSSCTCQAFYTHTLKWKDLLEVA